MAAVASLLWERLLSFLVGKGVGLSEPEKQFLVQLLGAAEDEVVGPAAGIGLGLDRHPVRV